MRVLSIVVVLCACGSGKPPPPPPPLVDVATIETTDVVDATDYLGALRSRTAAQIQPQVGGMITSILVKPGALVAANQPLMTIDPGRQPAALAQAKAGLTQAEANLTLAQRSYARVEEAVKRLALTGQELDNAKAQVDAAQAQVDAQKAAITSNNVQLAYFTVIAPSKGVIGDIPNRVGDTVTPQSVLTSVVDNTVLEANVAIPVERARTITHDTQIQILDDAGHPIGEGTASFVSSQVTPETQAVLVKAFIDNPKGTLRSEEVAPTRVVWAVKKGLQVPALAVTKVGGQAFVFVIVQDGMGQVVKQRPVTLGALRDNQYVVLDGLKPGERIATSNLQKLRDGAPIRIKG